MTTLNYAAALDTAMAEEMRRDSRSAAQHSQPRYALYAHLAGLKVVLPSGAADAKGLLKSAIRDNNPVVCFEPSRCDSLEEEVLAGDDETLVPIGLASVKRPGS